MNVHTAVTLDGNQTAAEIRAEAAEEVRRMRETFRPPGLAVILVGNDPGSEIYVRSKIKACEEVGIYSEKLSPSASVTTAELVGMIAELNRRDEIDGILVQLPLPSQVDARRVIESIAPEKDVDGIHPLNMGKLATQRPGLIPCTPSGIMELLRRKNIQVAGRHAVVIGRSEIVGRPMALLLLNHHATVTICHSKTTNLPELSRQADILVVAAGKAGLITKEFVKPGAVVIDVGINRITERAELERLFAGDPTRARTFHEKGWVLAGDVHPEVAATASAITPVPGGVGPLTIAMLLKNTIQACNMRRRAT